MVEFKFTSKEFEDWLKEEHKSSFKSVEQIKDFVNQGLAFLLISGSNLLKSYILRNVKLFDNQEKLLRTVSGQTYLWWFFSQIVEEVYANKENCTIVYNPEKRKFNFSLISKI